MKRRRRCVCGLKNKPYVSRCQRCGTYIQPRTIEELGIEAQKIKQGNELRVTTEEYLALIAEGELVFMPHPLQPNRRQVTWQGRILVQVATYEETLRNPLDAALDEAAMIARLREIV